MNGRIPAQAGSRVHALTHYHRLHLCFPTTSPQLAVFEHFFLAGMTSKPPRLFSLPSADDSGLPVFPPLRVNPARRRHLSFPAVTLAHRSQVHDCTAAEQVTKVPGPLCRSPKRHADAPQTARHRTASHVTQRRATPGCVGFGNSFSTRDSTRGKE